MMLCSICTVIVQVSNDEGQAKVFFLSLRESVVMSISTVNNVTINCSTTRVRALIDKCAQVDHGATTARSARNLSFVMSDS